MKKIYLAIPYTGMEELSFEIACLEAGNRMLEGHVVYSPISQNHPIAQIVKLPGDWEFWKRIDIEFIKWCDMVIVVPLPGWKESIGVQEEIKIARSLKKEVTKVQLSPAIQIHIQKWLDEHT